MELTEGRGLPAELIHFAIADRFGCSPADVLDWPYDVVEDAIAIMGAETRYRKRHPQPKAGP